MIFAYKIAFVVSSEYHENGGLTLSIRNNFLFKVFGLSKNLDI